VLVKLSCRRSSISVPAAGRAFPQVTLSDEGDSILPSIGGSGFSGSEATARVSNFVSSTIL